MRTPPTRLAVFGLSIWVGFAAVFLGTAGRAGAEPPAMLREALKGPMRGAEEVVFAVRGIGGDPHWYANFGYWSSDPNKKMYAPGGSRLCVVNILTGRVRNLVDDPEGSIRDPQVDYDGKTILFAYRKGGTEPYNLYEIQSDGTSLRQITTGPYDDIEPCYLPDGDIVFCSSRCRQWVSCWHTQVAILYRSDGDGKDIRRISGNIEHDNTPAVMPDGRLLYTRWEYVDRSQVTFHHLWTHNPDGTGQMAYFGNLHPGTVMIDARPIPGSGKVACIFSPGHGIKEHCGVLTVVDPANGPDEQERARRVEGAPGYARDPYPFSERYFLLARTTDLVLVDAAQRRHAVLYSLPPPDRRRGMQLHEPRPLRPRPRERIIPDRTEPASGTGRLVLQNVTAGRNMDGVTPGEIKKLLVLEVLPKPVNFSGGQGNLTWLGTFNLERALGTVPVEADGSAYIEVPAERPLFFVALDENDMSVKRMQSFVSVMPGETTSCVGCHEQRTRTPAIEKGSVLAALRHPPRRITPLEGVPDIIDFRRDIQPILDKHCVKCHNYRKRRGRAVLAGDLGIRFSHSYWTLIARNQVVDGRNGMGNLPPRAIGSSASPLMRKIDGSHHHVTLSERERRTIWLWIETGAVYAGTYAALDPGGDLPVRGFGLAAGVLNRRCFTCHDRPRQNRYPPLALPAAPRHGPHYTRLFLEDDPAARLSMQILFNLTHPEKSPLILGPLARKAGGYGSCAKEARSGRKGGPVFKDTSDPDYRILLETVKVMKRNVEKKGRFELPAFRPNVHYVREMKRFGILPASFDPATDPLDVYETDRAYFRSQWYRPAAAP